MTTYELIFVSGSIGLLIGMLIAYFDYYLGRKEWERIVGDLEFDKIMLLDSNEHLTRDRDELEQRYLLTSKGYAAHLGGHVCVPVEVDDRVLEAEFVE